MGRRLLPLMLAVAVATGCRARPPMAPSAGDAGAAPFAAPLLRPVAAAQPDAATDDQPAQPPQPLAVLSGPEAEKVIADSVTAREAPPPDGAELRISPTGVGRFVLGMSRREVLERLGRHGGLTRLRTAPGEVSVEAGDLLLASGLRLLRLRIYGGRLTEIRVVARDARARTDGDVGVGSTFDEAMLAHGDPRRTQRGYLLEDLPGVIFVPAAGVAGAAVPPPETRITQIIVVGPESD